MSTTPGLTGVPGGIGLRVDDYADFLAKEYLGDYVRQGGSAVRLVVPGDDEVAHRWHRRLEEVAEAEGYVYVPIDAAAVRVHLMQEVFRCVVSRVDLVDTARRVVRTAYDRIGVPAAAPSGLSVAEVAEAHDVDPRELQRSLRRDLETTILGDAALVHEFRRAMLRLCQAELRTGDVRDDERDAVLGWLRGEPVPLARMRGVGLQSRIGRHTARGLLLSLASWLARTRGTGLVLDLDLARLEVARRPPVEEREGLYYSRAAVFDAYELLRQLIDATDGLHSTVVSVVITPALVTDESRGLPSYSALHLRVADEVRDRRRANPFAALVRLETRVETVR